MSDEQPKPRPRAIVRWCPVCGREGVMLRHLRKSDLDDWCPGAPISLVYVLSPMHEKDGLFPAVRDGAS